LQGTTREEMLAWAAELPASQSPTWLGLPANAEMVLLANRAQMLTMNTMKLQTVDDDSPVIADPSSEKVCLRPHL